MAYIGIDYGRLTNTNRDLETGIHYGVISQHTVGGMWYEESQADYGDPTCPKCGNVANDATSDDVDSDDYNHLGGCHDYACQECKITFDSSEAYGDDPLGWHYEDDSYQLVDCLDSDIMILKAPFYTFAQYCSPCVPGAGNLDSPMEGGVKTYCLGHDWFESGAAPYPVYDVATGWRVEPPESEGRYDMGCAIERARGE